MKTTTSSDPEATFSQAPPLPITSDPKASTPASDIPHKVFPLHLFADELKAFKDGVKQILDSLTTSSSSAPNFVRQVVNRKMKPNTLLVDRAKALATLRLFNKTSFKIFEDKELWRAMKFICQTLLENEEINDKDKKTLSEFLSSFEFNCFILDKVLEDRRILEVDMVNSEKKIEGEKRN